MEVDDVGRVPVVLSLGGNEGQVIWCGQGGHLEGQEAAVCRRTLEKGPHLRAQVDLLLPGDTGRRRAVLALQVPGWLEEELTPIEGDKTRRPHLTT